MKTSKPTKSDPDWKLFICPRCGAKPQEICQDFVGAGQPWANWVKVGPHFARLKLPRVQYAAFVGALKARG